MNPEDIAAVIASLPMMEAISAKDIQTRTGLGHEQVYRILAHLEARGSAQVSVRYEGGMPHRVMWEAS